LTDEALEKVVSNCLIYEIPVPFAALEAVCQSVPNYQKKLQQAQDKGLIEVICNEDRETFYRASHIKHINPHIELPKDASNLSALAGTAAKVLTELWGNKENQNREKWAEIFRLAFAESENPERFREQFDKMISVQYNREADRVYEKELRKQREHLIANQEQIYQKLEEYLSQKDWKKADYETAFIMYQWMVIENYDDFIYLFTEVSLDVINEIDFLWVKHSEGKFGIKGQAKIFVSCDLDTGNDVDIEEAYHLVWASFSERIGWMNESWWVENEEVAYHATTQPIYYFPILMYARIQDKGFWDGGFWGADTTGVAYPAQGFYLVSRADLTECSTDDYETL
jgi:hypothetical protein